MATFNIDKMKSGFEPVDILFRGTDYLLGRNALGIIRACEVHGEFEDKNGMAYLGVFLERLPEILTALCPELPVDDLETGESIALIKVCTEVFGRIGRINFQAEDEETHAA